MPVLVLIVKGAAVASLLILAWAAFASRKTDAGAPTEGARPDPVGARVMQGFTAMLVVGAVSMFAITVIDMASHL